MTSATDHMGCTTGVIVLDNGLDTESLYTVATQCMRLCKRWVLAFCDVESVARWKAALEDRAGVLPVRRVGQGRGYAAVHGRPPRRRLRGRGHRAPAPASAGTAAGYWRSGRTTPQSTAAAQRPRAPTMQATASGRTPPRNRSHS